MPPKKKVGSKKKKGGDKKKKGAQEDIDEYDVDKMTIVELKNYAHMLENGIEEMRKHSSFNQKAETELMFLFETRRKELEKQEEALLARDVEIEALRSKVEEKIREKNCSVMYKEYDSGRLEHLLKSRTIEQLDNLSNQHKNEQLEMREELLKRERELEVLSKKIQMAKKVATEETYKKLEDIAAYEKKLMDKCTKEFEQMIADTDLEFNLTLKSIESEALEAKRIAEQEFRSACLSYKEKLQQYYKNVTRTDLDTIRDLKLRITELEQDTAKNTLKLKEIKSQNLELKAKTPRYISIKVSDKVGSNKSMKNELTNSHNSKKIEKYSEENKRLEEEIQKVENECNNLRDQFTLSLCKVRESANLKAVILEKKLDRLFASMEKSDNYSNLAKSEI